MNIGAYTFLEFKQLAQNFHGYAAPGLLIGGYMVEKAKALLPEGTLFEAVVESGKCLPDAVQLLTLCSTGNSWMKVQNLGRYAVSLVDKYTGEGFRVSVDTEALKAYPEIYSWFFKKTPKREQDTELLEKQIEEAGDKILKVDSVTVKRRFLGHKPMEGIGTCFLCKEAYPTADGPICRGCQGEAPYVLTGRVVKESFKPANITIVPVEEAINKKVAHDMTRIEPGQFKGPEFKAGQRISVGDVCRLQQMGRFNVAIQDDEVDSPYDLIHENEVAELFAKRMVGENITYALPPHEGKIDFVAEQDGVLCVDSKRLELFNMVPDIMCASRQDGTLLKEGSRFAGTRAIPLFLDKKYLHQAVEILADKPIFNVKPLRQAKVGILVTGTEIFQGIIEDKFIPIITGKVKNLHCTVVGSRIVPDKLEAMAEAISELRNQGADLLITTGGLSVDPDDVTRIALMEAGLTNVLHGVPVLPGAMSLIGMIPANEENVEMQVLGVPACALYFKTTFFDLILPRVLARCEITRAQLASMGEGGYCMSCQTCTWPKCWFGK